MAGKARTPDFLVIGGGIMGLTVALEIKRRRPDCSLVLIEKEKLFGYHASGRNSGVLHAGFYYDADSLKARFTRDGNRLLTEYCLENDLPINRCGKLVVTRSEPDIPVLEELVERGRRNGVAVERLTAAQAREIEPRARSRDVAMFSPDTATVDPRAIVSSLVGDLRAAGADVLDSTPYLRRHKGVIETATGEVFDPGYVVNAAGLYADRIAHDFGHAHNLHILPFKGTYLTGPPGERLNTNVYPVPDLGMPFLGVHFTVTVDGRVKIGPTALPAGWREHYGGLANFHLGEAAEILMRQTSLLLRNQAGYRAHARNELSKLSRRRILRLASELVPDVAGAKGWEWGKPAIRAQLYDTEANSLVMDFLFRTDDRSMHVLNAVSPAFTSSLPFSAHLADRIKPL